MALVLKDRVQETTTTTGTGTVTLDGAVSGFQSFSAIGNGNTCYYAIVGGTEWEVGLGTYTSSGTTLSRDTILESSNGGTAVNFSAGTKNVFVTYPAEKSVDIDTAQTLTNKTISADNNTLSGIAASSFVLSNASGNIDGSAAQKAIPSGEVVGTTDTQTLTNKRVTPRVSTTTSSATPTINTDNVDVYGLTAQAADITSFTTNLSGTPTDGQTLRIYIVGTAARAITWGASFEASTVSLPTTTVTTNRLDVGFLWNAATSKWRCVAVA